MKKFIYIALALIALAVLSGCGNILHNTPASYVTLELVNFPLEDGSYYFAGSFADFSWNPEKREIKMAGGKGTFTDTTQTMIISGDFNFSIVTKTWGRPWTAKTDGNVFEYGAWQNIKVTVPMDGGTHKITVDGSTPKATFKVE